MNLDDSAIRLPGFQTGPLWWIGGGIESLLVLGRGILPGALASYQHLTHSLGNFLCVAIKWGAFWSFKGSSWVFCALCRVQKALFFNFTVGTFLFVMMMNHKNSIIYRCMSHHAWCLYSSPHKWTRFVLSLWVSDSFPPVINNPPSSNELLLICRGTHHNPQLFTTLRKEETLWFKTIYSIFHAD